MMADLKTLIGKLNPLCRQALEEAAARAVAESNFQVETEHVLATLMDTPGSDVDEALGAMGVPRGRLRADLDAAIGGFKRGAGRTPAFSPLIQPVLQEAWTIASLRLEARQIRSGALLLAMVDMDSVREPLLATLPTLAALNRDLLRRDLADICAASSKESGFSASAGTGVGGSPRPCAPATGPGSGGDSRTPALDAYTRDLTAEARDGRLDPIIGRESEIRQVIDILIRRRQNNPILTGEAGVGKTAVVEGFAQAVVAGAVPPALKTVAVHVLDMGLLEAGAGVKGEFERRLTQVIDEVQGAAHPVILFIDEAHTLVGKDGSSDAANLLKPPLARGLLRTIAATTWLEYKQYFEKDPALARRFQVVKVDEPAHPVAVAMLRGLVPRLEAHHGVRIRESALAEAVALSHRYISGRQLPDKAVSVLDTACARVAIAQSTRPAALEDVDQRLLALKGEAALLAREAAAGHGDVERLDQIDGETDRLEESRIRLESQWRAETELVVRLLDLRGRLEAGEGDRVALADAARQTEMELEALRDGTVLVPVAVDGDAVAAVVSAWTGVPVGKMLRDTIDTVLTLRDRLGERIVGQPQALDGIARRIRTASADLAEPGKPPGVFLLVGPSGVGKTETAIALADLLYGGERNMVTINMSEYQEAHSVSNLKGAPPGYVGHGRGGVLTEAIRRRPHTVLLLDEVEKAHPDVLEMFYQVFDKGILEDSEGTPVSFRETLILLTSNLGTDALMAAGRDPAASAEVLAAAVRPALKARLKPALLARMVVVPYRPLGDDHIRRVVALKLARVQARFQEAHGAELTCDPALVAAIADRCTEVDSGARAVDHILTQTLLPALSEQVLHRLAAEAPFEAVHLDLDAGPDLVRCRFY